MNPDRSTDGFTPSTYLNLIQRGGTEDWKRLYRLCHDPGIARQVAAMLPMRDPDMMASAQIWKFLLEDLHPDMKLAIDLRETRRSIGA
jgi:hypothetical protein